MRLPIQILLILLSAALLPLCFPPYEWWPLVLISFPLLLLATNNTSTRRAFYLGMLQGMLGYGAALYWFFYIFDKAAIPLFAIPALFIALFCLLFNLLAKQIQSTVLKVLMAATLWTAIEFYRSELFFLRFPWITPGTALGPTFLSPILGVYGASFLVIAASFALTQRKTLPLGFLVSVCVICLGLCRPGRVEPDKGESIGVTVVQSEECVLQSYVALTRTTHKGDADLIVWPEYALPYDVRKYKSNFNILTNLCNELDAVLIVGTQTIIGTGKKDWRNTALALDEHGVIGEYYKNRPVHFFNDGIPGDSFAPIQTDIGAIATPICFDCDYTEVARKMASLGAEYFAVPSFDAESWSATQHLQHAALFRLRAVENARWLACAASSGVSQIIDPHGNVHRSLPPMEKGSLTYRIGRAGRKTFFTQVGWFFPWLTMGASAILIARMGIQYAAERQASSIQRVDQVT